MFNRIRKFPASEDGAVTVDWVVLTAVVLGLAGAVVVSVQDGTESAGSSVSTHLSNRTVDAGF